MNAPTDGSGVGALHRRSDWSAYRVAVAGLGVAGFACADALVQVGARVVAFDRGDSDTVRERATLLEMLGAEATVGGAETLPADVDLLVVSPGLPPTHDVIRQAHVAGVPVWGELELGWRLRDPDRAAPWLAVTGTNGKTTTTMMLAAMLRAAGLRAPAVGNIGLSLVEAVMDPQGFDVLAVEVSATQMPFVTSMSPESAACLNVGADHVDFFGSFDAYARAKARVYENTRVAVVFNVEDVATERMVEDADVVAGCRAVGFTLGVPAPSMLGVVDDMLVDRAFVEDRRHNAQELASVHDVVPFAPHNVANALAAAALARAHGVPPTAVRDGLRAFRPAAHRAAPVGDVGGVRFVDDSKATNGHAAETSLLGHESVVWIAGGQAKGQSFDDLVARVASRLRGVVLLGVDRGIIADALARHAPDVPVVDVDRTDTGAMDDVVRAAYALARPGDTVLLAPGCASWDMFRDYGERGDVFAGAVAALAAEQR